MALESRREMSKLVIAIDGPAGSGKSTTAKAVAARLGFTYLDTGAMYRAVTLKAIRERCDLSDGDKLKRFGLPRLRREPRRSQRSRRSGKYWLNARRNLVKPAA